MFMPKDPQFQPALDFYQIRLSSQHVLTYRLKRSQRRSIGLAIDGQGLMVSAPRWVTLSDIENALRQRQQWIAAKITLLRERQQRIPRVHWENGGTLPFLGKSLTLSITQGIDAQNIHFDEQQWILHIALPPTTSAQQLKDCVQNWLQAQAKKLFTQRLDFYAARLGLSYCALRLSAASTRWGSCSAKGKIALSWRLIHFPLSVIDYVVAHELAHLKEMNHSPRFWHTVATLLPDFANARKHLRNYPPELLPLL